LFADKRVEEQIQTGVPDDTCVVPGDDSKVTPSAPGNKTDKRSGKSKKKQKRKKGTETGVEKKDLDVPAAAAYVPVTGPEVLPDSDGNEGAITDTPVVTGAGDTPAEPESAINVEDRLMSPAEARSTDEPDGAVRATSSDDTVPAASADGGVRVTYSDEEIPVSAVEDAVVPATDTAMSTLVTGELVVPTYYIGTES
jgi:hypothetical protein